MKNKHRDGLIITVIGALLLSLESLLIKLTTVSALTFSFYISIFMLISTNAMILLNKKTPFFSSYKISFKGILICGFLFGISNIFFIASLKNTTVVNAVLIFSLAPIFASIYMYVLFKEKSSKNIYISTFFISVGLYISFSSQLGTGQLLGNIYAFICIAVFSLSFVIISRFKDINMLAVISVSCIVSALIVSLFNSNINIDINSLYVILLAGFLISPLARLLMGMGANMIPASEVSLLMIIETIMAPVWVWIFLNEIPNNNTLIGGIIILCTLILNSLYIIKAHK